MELRQLEPTVVTVDETKFYITPFPAFTAANLTGELASVLSPLLGVFSSLLGNSEGKDLGDIDVTEAATAMSGCTNIDGDKLEKLMRKLLLGGNVVVEFTDDEGNTEAERLNMDLANEIFCGNVHNMFVLCFHVIKLNFNGFFKKLASQSGKLEMVKARKRKVF